MINKQLKILKNEPLLFITLILAFPVLIIIIFISPIIYIRIGHLHCDRIGHFALNTELYLLEKKYFKKKTNSLFQLDIFYLPRSESCNRTLENLWRKRLNILPKFTMRPLCLLIRSSSIISKYFRCGGTLNGERDINNLLDRYQSEIELGKDFIKDGREGLITLGIPKDSKYVCLIVRDSNYLKELYGKDFEYHSYRDNNIEKFLDAAEELTKYGYYKLLKVCLTRQRNYFH